MFDIAQLTPASSGSVMIVDDSSENLTLLENMLRRSDLETRSFPLGRLALAAAEYEPPDLILLDINMPEMSGYEVCERLKDNPRLSQIPVIFLSALDGVDNKVRGFQAGAVDYISKPFQFEEVLARVTTQVKLKGLQNQIQADNHRLEDLVRAQVKKIADAQLETIFAIAKLANTRDDQTGSHLERIQAYCRALAEGMREHPAFESVVDGEWIENFVQSSALHDIGKVGIPDNILRKPGKLTAEEFAIMKTHTVLGAQTLSEVYRRYPGNEFIAMGIDTARSHHECWNGAGYPDGLVGEAIPLCARVLAIADCYDAVRSHRYYKPGLSHDHAREVILQNAGLQFDPSITAVFASIGDSFAEISNRKESDVIPVHA